MTNETHVYIAPDASGLNFHQAVGDSRVFVQFVDGNYRTDDVELAKAIDADIAAGHLSRWVRKVDRAAGERLVREHMASRAGTGAHAGQQTSQSTANLSVLQARDQELHKMANADEIVDKLAEESDLLITEPVLTAEVAKVAEVAEPAAKTVGLAFAPKANA